MKKIILLLSFLFLGGTFAWSQDIVLVGWTFPGSSAEADTGLVINLGNEISTMGGTSEIEFKNGLSSKAAQVTGWDNGMDQKAWLVSLSSEDYQNLSISSRQQSGGNDQGPKDYKIQYSIDGGLSWIDVDNGGIIVENDWDTSFVDNLELPEVCGNQAELMIRWIMTSNIASGTGGDVLESGKSKIDEIFVRGDQISAINEWGGKQEVSFGPNPASDFVNIFSNKKMQSIQLMDISGKVVLKIESGRIKEGLDVSSIKVGIYILMVKGQDEELISSSKLMIK